MMEIEKGWKMKRENWVRLYFRKKSALSGAEICQPPVTNLPSYIPN